MADRTSTPPKRTEAELAHSRRLESLGLLTASVVHDLNNLLTPILCFSALLAEELAGGSSSRHAAEEIGRAATRAAQLTRQLLVLARKEASERTRFDLRESVREMRGLIEGVIGCDIELVLSLGPEPAQVWLNRDQFERVLLNLVANARDAMPDGGSLTIQLEELAPSDEERGAEASAACVVLAVKDTGVGMTSDVRARALEPFFTTKPAGAGTGLGLATAQRFAHDSGGAIDVRSEPGRGAQIVMRLPIAGVLPGEASQRAPRHEPPGGSETILVVDGDEQVRRAICRRLEKRGYSVLDAASEQAALQRVAASGHIALVLIDVGLRQFRAEAFIEKLSAFEPVPRVLFMSGHTDDVLLRHGLAPDEPALLRKAFSDERLAYAVRAVLDGRALR